MRRNVMTDFYNKLADKKTELRKQANFLNDHNFHKEKQFILDKITIVEEIQFALDEVIKGKDVKQIELKF